MEPHEIEKFKCGKRNDHLDKPESYRMEKSLPIANMIEA